MLNINSVQSGIGSTLTITTNTIESATVQNNRRDMNNKENVYKEKSERSIGWMGLYGRSLSVNSDLLMRACEHSPDLRR